MHTAASSFGVSFGPKAVEDEAPVEPSFRRLRSALESEKERLRGVADSLEQERVHTTQEVMRIRQQNDEWCHRETHKVEIEWNRLDAVNELLSQFFPEEPSDPIYLRVKGRVFVLSRHLLLGIQGSKLYTLLTEERYLQEIPFIEGYYELDFNPECFEIVVQYMQNYRLNPKSPIPIVPKEQLINMELMAEELRLEAFMSKNSIAQLHTTSLQVSGNLVRSTHPGWQFISSVRPLSIAKVSYFETQIVWNPDSKGGLAIGVSAHVPRGSEVFSIKQPNSMLYVSENGVMSDSLNDTDAGAIRFGRAPKPVAFNTGGCLGIRHDPIEQSITWYFNGVELQKNVIGEEFKDNMKTLYPIFGMFIPDQKIQVDFMARLPTQTS